MDTSEIIQDIEFQRERKHETRINLGSTDTDKDTNTNTRRIRRYAEVPKRIWILQG